MRIVLQNKCGLITPIRGGVEIQSEINIWSLCTTFVRGCHDRGNALTETFKQMKVEGLDFRIMQDTQNLSHDVS